MNNSISCQRKLMEGATTQIKADQVICRKVLTFFKCHHSFLHWKISKKAVDLISLLHFSKTVLTFKNEYSTRKFCFVFLSLENTSSWEYVFLQNVFQKCHFVVIFWNYWKHPCLDKTKCSHAPSSDQPVSQLIFKNDSVLPKNHTHFLENTSMIQNCPHVFFKNTPFLGKVSCLFF